MPRFLAPITVGQETVTGSETISGNQIILSATFGKDSYWTSVSASGGLSADSGSFVKNVSALGFYGDGSKLTGITTGNYLSASGGTLTGALTGTIGVFTTSLSATSLSGVHYGDGSRLTGIIASGGTSTDSTKLPLSGGTLTGGITGTTALFSTSISAFTLSGNYYGDGTNLTGVIHDSDSRLSNSRAPSGAAGGDLSGTYPNPTVAKIQGYNVSTQTPSAGQIMQWSGTAWVPGSIPQGGSGGGGISYFLNYGTASDSHPGLSDPIYELGRFTYTTLTSATLTNVATNAYTPIAGFITDFLDPVVSTIPAGLWDIAIWLSSTATNTTQMILQAELYTYNTALSTTTLIATSDDLDIYDPTVIAQYTPSIVVPQTTISSNDRIYLKLLAKATSNNKDITVYFGGNRPSHIHTTIPSVGGSGLVKVINGIYQTPASLLVNVDVADNAEINQTKISGLTAALASKLPLSGGTLTGGITGTTAQFSGAVYGSTAVAGTSSTQLATTAFVQDNLTTGLASGSAVASTVVAFVTNADSVPLVRGNVVYSYGSQGDRASVRLASASAESTSSKTFGFVNETIAVGQTGYVTLYGTMDKLDLGSPFVAGDPLWLGTTPGTYTRTKPVAPTHLVYLGVVERANAGNGTAYIKVQNGYELNEIHDVLITNPLSSQILQRNSSNTLWVNQTPLFDDTQIVNSSKWNTAYSVATGYQSVSSTYVTLTGTQKLTNKTVIDWMTLVRGYNTTPTLLATIGTGDVYTYVYNSSPSNVTYYRYIATDGSVDAFYTYYSGSTLSGLVASKSITI